MKHALQSLGCLFLCLLCILTYKAVLLADRASEAILELSSTTQQVRQVVAKVGPQVEGAAREQRSYYKATGKALAIATIKLGRTAEEAQGLVSDARKSLEVFNEQVRDNGAASQRLLGESESQVKAIGLEAQRSIGGIDRATAALTDALAPLPNASRNLVALTASAADTASHADAGVQHLESAAQSVDEALKPLRKTEGKLKAVLKIILGMVKFDPRR